jgi:tRNA threonylcarbamoyladenosine dehydratase
MQVTLEGRNESVAAIQAKSPFTGIERLYGSEGLQRLQEAHVAVIGLGGVGSWCVEALARSGIGQLTLIDRDDICVTNINRQLPALETTVGESKTTLLSERVKRIHSLCQVHPVHRFFTPANADELLNTGYDFVVDAIDRMSLKALLIAKCHERQIPLVTVGGAGGRRSATQIRIADLSETFRDELLRQVRKKLRRAHAFPRTGRMDVAAVFSTEPIERPDVCDGLRCDTGYGSSGFVTGAFGLAAADLVVNTITGQHPVARLKAQGSRIN